MLKIQSICTVIAKSFLLTVIKQIDRNRYLLNIFFRFLSFLYIEEYRDRYSTFSTENFIISNNQNLLKSRILLFFDNRIRTNNLLDTDLQQRNSVSDYLQFYANFYTNFA